MVEGGVRAFCLLPSFLHGGTEGLACHCLLIFGNRGLIFCRGRRAVLFLVYILILARETEEDVEKATVTKEEVFALRKDLFVGWRDAGLRM
jgi:hypothetical protein